MSAFGGKADSQKGGLLRLLLTLSGHQELGLYTKTELGADVANRFII